MELILEAVGEVLLGGVFSFIGAVCRFPFINKRKKLFDLMKEEESSELGAIIFILPLIITAIYFIYIQ